MQLFKHNLWALAGAFLVACGAPGATPLDVKIQLDVKQHPADQSLPKPPVICIWQTGTSEICSPDNVAAPTIEFALDSDETEKGFSAGIYHVRCQIDTTTGWVISQCPSEVVVSQANSTIQLSVGVNYDTSEAVLRSEAKLDELATAISAATEQRDEVVANLETVTGELQDTRDDLADVQADLIYYGDQVTLTRQELQGLELDVQSLQVTLATYQQDVSDAVQERADLQSDIDDLQLTLSGYQQDVSDATQERADLQSDIDSLLITLADYQQDVSDATSERNALQTQISSLQTTLATYQQDVSDAVQERADLQSDIDDLQLTLSGYQQDVSDATQERADLQSDIDSLLITLADYQQDVSDATSERNALQTQISSLQTTLATYQQDVSDAVQERDEILQEIEDLQNGTYGEVDFLFVDGGGNPVTGAVVKSWHVNPAEEATSATDGVTGFTDLPVGLSLSFTFEATAVGFEDPPSINLVLQNGAKVEQTVSLEDLPTSSTLSWSGASGFLADVGGTTDISGFPVVDSITGNPVTSVTYSSGNTSVVVIGGFGNDITGVTAGCSYVEATAPAYTLPVQVPVRVKDAFGLPASCP